MKIAVCGAGVAGPALAFWLSRTGHQVTLIEEAPRFRAGGYMIDLWGVGYTVAEHMGIAEQIQAAGYPVQEVRFVDGNGRRTGGFGIGVFKRMLGNQFTSLPRGDLAWQIYRTIEARVETLFDITITSLEVRKDEVLVWLGDNARRFDLLIGADGLHSRVRNLTFGPEANFERKVGYYVAAFESDGYRPRNELVYVSRGLPGRQISRFALRDDRTMFLFVFAAEHLREREPRTLQERKSPFIRFLMILAGNGRK